MSKDLEGRISKDSLEAPSEDGRSTIVFNSGTFPCHLIKAEIDFEASLKILCIKSSFEVMNNIYNGWMPECLQHAGKELRFNEELINRVVCEKIDSPQGPLAILTLEIAK